MVTIAFLMCCQPSLCLQEHDIITTLEDKTEVDEEYFEFLGNGTKLFISTSRHLEKIDYNKLSSFLRTCLERELQIHNKLWTCLHEKGSSKQAAALLQVLLNTTDAALDKTSKDDDADWFKGKIIL